MINLILAATLLLLVPSAEASQVIGVFLEKNGLYVKVLDNPTRNGPYEAAELYAFLNAPVIQRPYKSPVKIVSTKNFTLKCVVPLVTQPIEIKFSECIIELFPGEGSVISEYNKTASYQLHEEDALNIFNQFSVIDSKQFTWESADKQVFIESTPLHFIFNFRGR